MMKSWFVAMVRNPVSVLTIVGDVTVSGMSGIR